MGVQPLPESADVRYSMGLEPPVSPFGIPVVVTHFGDPHDHGFESGYNVPTVEQLVVMLESIGPSSCLERVVDDLAGWEPPERDTLASIPELIRI